MTFIATYIVIFSPLVAGCSQESELLGSLSDDAFTGSSYFAAGHEYPQSRLNTISAGGNTGGWAAGSSAIGQYIEADLGARHRLAKIALQGRENGDQWVTTYFVAFSLNGSSYDYILDSDGTEFLFTGNTDRNTIVNNTFASPVIARYIRIYPRTWFQYITMRWGAYGCHIKDWFEVLYTDRVPAVDAVHTSTVSTLLHCLILCGEANQCYSVVFVPGLQDINCFFYDVNNELESYEFSTNTYYVVSK